MTRVTKEKVSRETERGKMTTLTEKNTKENGKKKICIQQLKNIDAINSDK